LRSCSCSQAAPAWSGSARTLADRTNPPAEPSSVRLSPRRAAFRGVRRQAFDR
jgi:hypothetical protein